MGILEGVCASPSDLQKITITQVFAYTWGLFRVILRWIQVPFVA
jgi:hypothetical protein